MYGFILFIVGLISGFLIDKLPIKSIALKIAKQSYASMAVLQSKEIGDDKKQKLLLVSSINIFKETLKLASILCLIGIIIPCFSYIYTLLKPNESYNLLAFATTFKGISISILSVFLYFILTKIYAHFRI